MSFSIDNYVEVKDRIAAFYEKYPQGSLQSEYEVCEIDGQTTIVARAEAYRSEEDERPGIGHASEPVPGLTPYTKNSELMNAETSAWGRALAALGFKVDKGIASANEVRNRSGNDNPDHAPAASPKQKGLITRCCNDHAINAAEKAKLYEWAGGEPFTIPKASKLIELLKEAEDHADVLKRAGIEPEGTNADLPADVPDEPKAVRDLDDVPFG